MLTTRAFHEENQWLDVVEGAVKAPESASPRRGGSPSGQTGKPSLFAFDLGRQQAAACPP